MQRAVEHARMADSIIVMPGSARLDLSPIEDIAGEFGWDVSIADDQRQTAAVMQRSRIVAVLLCRDAFGPGVSWHEAIRLLRRSFAGVPVIALHGFAESIQWPELADAGAFHSLWLPLKANEVRQSLGFVSNARKRPAELVEWTAVNLPRVVAAGSIAA